MGHLGNSAGKTDTIQLDCTDVETLCAPGDAEPRFGEYWS